MKDAPFLNLVLAVVLVIAIGFMLIIGRAILLPIVTAVISVYLLESASNSMRHIPLMRRMPTAILRLLLMVLFTLVVVVFAIAVAATVREITTVAPIYEANIDVMINRLADRYDLERQALWDEIRTAVLDRFDLSDALVAALGGFTSTGAAVFLIVLYASFLMVEQASFARKITAVVGDAAQARRTLDIISDINRQISDYLAVKTLINIALGLVSYVILFAMGVDFALFWAVIIGLLNYIPYVGSIIGVAFPVVLSLAQFGSLPKTLALAALLGVIQFILGSVVEPRLIGRRLNLSPIVVLIALSIWTAVWGIPGAILAVPMTSMLAIVLASFENTRPIALLLAERVETDGVPAQDAGTADQ